MQKNIHFKRLIIIAFVFAIFSSCVNNKKNASLFISNTYVNTYDKVNKPNQTKPNIIVIVVDDAGYVDFGFMGSKDLDTPEIDKLAKEGTIFTDAHVTATVCAPSRAGILTGRYQQTFGFEANHTGDEHTGDIGLANNIPVIASEFKKNSYKTVAIGKWHVGEKENNHPNSRGFDDFYGFLKGGRSYFPIKNPSEDYMLQYNKEKVNFEGYLTDVLGDYSVKFVEENKQQPFFMYLAYNAVHTPMEAKESHLKKYENHPRQKLAAMTWSLDENIGKLVDKLKELHLFDNTLIFFLSDNGGATTNQANNGHLKGWKGNKFEGGHRVPFVVSWPNQIKPNQTYNGLTSSLDIFTTAIAAANIKVDYAQELNGVNLIPYLKGEKSGNPHKELYWRKLEESAARIDNYKLIKLDKYGVVLYNLENDISEQIDLSKKDTITTSLLKEKLSNWESKLMNPLWVEDKDWMNVTYHIHQRLMQNKKALYTEPRKNMKISKN